jgi:predicted small secreted protein
MRTRIVKWSGIVLTVWGGTLLSACATAPNVQTNVSPNADFGQYKTYAFVEGVGQDIKAEYNISTRKSMEDAIAREFGTRGYERDIGNPDLLIDYHLKTQDKEVMHSGMYVGGYSGFYNGTYMGSPSYVEPPYVDKYTEGTISVDVIDRRTNQVSWSGKLISRVSGRNPAHPDQWIEQTIGAIFAKYPYRAGNATPVYDVNP